MAWGKYRKGEFSRKGKLGMVLRWLSLLHKPDPQSPEGNQLHKVFLWPLPCTEVQSSMHVCSYTWTQTNHDRHTTINIHFKEEGRNLQQHRFLKCLEYSWPLIINHQLPTLLTLLLVFVFFSAHIYHTWINISVSDFSLLTSLQHCLTLTL